MDTWNAYYAAAARYRTHRRPHTEARPPVDEQLALRRLRANMARLPDGRKPAPDAPLMSASDGHRRISLHSPAHQTIKAR